METANFNTDNLVNHTNSFNISNDGVFYPDDTDNGIGDQTDFPEDDGVTDDTLEDDDEFIDTDDDDLIDTEDDDLDEGIERGQASEDDGLTDDSVIDPDDTSAANTTELNS